MKRASWPAALLLFVAVAAVIYFPALHAPFIFDDDAAILSNPNVRQLWPLSQSLWAPANAPVAGRPLVSFTLALNHALGGEDVFGYHLFNLLVHIACAALVFAAVRRALMLRRLAPRFATLAEPFALAIALVWLCHPLNSEAVIYVTQRTELLMALFYLATLACSLRSLAEPGKRAWQVLGVAACLLGMASKEVMVTAPVLVIFAERAFHFESFAEAWRARSRYYLALASTWIVLAGLVISAPHAASVSSEGGISSWQYLLNQGVAIPRYLAQSLFPFGLSLDYGEALPISLGAAAPGGLLLLGLLGLSVWAWRREPAWGFLGAWFFLVLAPSSSVVPIFTEVAAERRVYLSLLAVLCAAFAGGVLLSTRLTGNRPRGSAVIGAAVLLALAGAVATRARAADYNSPLALWQGAVHVRPENHRARNNLAKLRFEAGEVGPAIAETREALKLQPRYAGAHANLCAMLVQQEKLEEAKSECALAVEQRPDVASHRAALALVLSKLARPAEAEPHYLKAVELTPNEGRFRVEYGLFLTQQGNFPAAITQFERAIALSPSSASAHSALGGALASAGRPDEGRPHLEQALRLDPKSAAALVNLAKLEATGRQWDLSIAHARQALALEPSLFDGHNTLVFALLGSGKRKEATSWLQGVTAQQPGNVAARKLLGIVLAQDGDFRGAQLVFRDALRLAPGNGELQQLLQKTEAQLSVSAPVP